MRRMMHPLNLFTSLHAKGVSAMTSDQTLRPRIRVFVDYWNLQITLNQKESKITGQKDVRFKVNWRDFPGWVANKAAEVVGVTEFSYEGAIIYVSYNPKTVIDRPFHNWLVTWLDRQPGIQVDIRERQPKAAPQCQSCHQPIESCPNCGVQVAGTVEKGVDTALVTDMIRLAWEASYEVAVVVSSDRDLVPAVQYLDSKGRKVIQAGFPPSGVHLATACWASFDLFPLREQFRRSE